MQRHPAEGIGAAVEQEPLLCIHREEAESNAYALFVHPIGRKKRNLDRIAVGVLNAVPKVRFGDLPRVGDILNRVGRDFHRDGFTGHSVPLRVVHRYGDRRMMAQPDRLLTLYEP